jgi:hypothetical protein
MHWRSAASKWKDGRALHPVGAGLLAMAGVVLVVCAPARAVTTEYWVTEGPAAFGKGENDGTAVTPEGTIILGPGRETLVERKETYLWDILPGDKGTLFLATGSEGSVLRLPSGGSEAETVYLAPEERTIFALGRSRDGKIIAGLSPGGLLMRIDPSSGTADTLADFDEEYIWDILVSPAGDIYVATGSPARVYRLSPEGRDPTDYYDPEDEHAYCLALSPKGDLLVGTSGLGITYQITAPQEGRVLYDARQREVKALAVGPDGSIYLGATGEESPSDSNGGSGSASSGPGPGVYRVNPDGTVTKLWSCPESVLYTLVLEDEEDLLVGTGDDGKLYRVSTSPDHGATLLATLEEPQIISLLRVGGRSYVGTANPATLHRLAGAPAGEGSYLSEVHDAGQICRWGTLSWKGDPGGGRIRFETRSGNTAEPGRGWNPWSELRLDDRSGPVASPTARYLQWRARLSGSQTTPRLDRVRVAFLVPNMPPRIHRLSVSPSGAPLATSPPGSPPPPLHQVLPSGVEIQYSVRQPSEQAEEEPPLWARALRTAEWEASDPNGDPLLFDIHYQAAGESEWYLLEKDWEGTAYSWNASSFPDGLYRVRVTASDRRGNPPGEGATVQRTSDYFLVDNTPPEITRLELKREGKGYRLRASARDRRGTIYRARYAVNGGDWNLALPEDGLFDETEESFDFPVEVEGSAKPDVVFRVLDEAGNASTRRTREE